MEIAFDNEEMVVRLSPLEKLAAFKWSDIRVPRSSIEGVERSLPPPTWKELRVPGTFIPGLIKAGSYYTDRGWEFWYVTRTGKSYPVTVSLKEQRYARLVLGFQSGSEADRLEDWLRRGRSSE
jgi:hypothetical protein